MSDNPIAIVFNGEHSYLVISNPELNLSTYSQSICENDMIYVEFKSTGMHNDIILGYADTMLQILKGLDDKTSFEVSAIPHYWLGEHNTGSIVAFRNVDSSRMGMFASFTEPETLYSGMK